MVGIFIWLMEREWLPDSVLRWGIRRLCRDRLKLLEKADKSGHWSSADYAEKLTKSALAEHTKSANQQHYEIPARFFQIVLGKNRKYSCALFDGPVTDLDAAEEAALAKTVHRAELKDGMKILELGCGWGSLTLYMARRFPNAQITAYSNSNSQREYIEATAKKLGYGNVTIKTGDLSSENVLSQIPKDTFDRIVSVEMFEHFKNYSLLLKHCSSWLKSGGKLFVHIFTHQKYSYPFEVEGEDNWMGKYFFTGGQMPARDLLGFFQKDLKLQQEWQWNGAHYQKTSEAWLKNLDNNREEIMSFFPETYGKDSKKWVARWRVFFISCAELFGYENGEQWGVTHYLFATNK